MYGDKSMFSRMWDYLTRDPLKTVEYRTEAFLCFLPKWRGFLVSETTENMNATVAIMKLYDVANCLSNVWIKEFGGSRREMKLINFDVRKVII